jgi:hypothetical protein
MELLKNTMAILEKMNYNEWPSKITYQRQHMEWSRVRIIVATQKMMKLITIALNNCIHDLAVVADFVTVETKSIKRGGRVIHYQITVHRKGDSMFITNSQDTTAEVFPHEPRTIPGSTDQEHVRMTKDEFDALGKQKGYVHPLFSQEEKPYLVLTRRMLKALMSLSMKQVIGVVVLRMELAGNEWPGQMNLTSGFESEAWDARDAEDAEKETA